MRKILFVFLCLSTTTLGQQQLSGPTIFTAPGKPLMDCTSLNGPIGPLKDCHLVNGATLDDLANEFHQEQQRMKAEYAKMAGRYLRCAGLLKTESKP